MQDKPSLAVKFVVTEKKSMKTATAKDQMLSQKVPRRIRQIIMCGEQKNKSDFVRLLLNNVPEAERFAHYVSASVQHAHVQLVHGRVFRAFRIVILKRKNKYLNGIADPGSSASSAFLTPGSRIQIQGGKKIWIWIRDPE